MPVPAPRSAPIPPCAKPSKPCCTTATTPRELCFPSCPADRVTSRTQTKEAKMTDLRIAILDDYQYAARRYGDWNSLDAQLEVFHEPFADADAVVSQLAEF